MRDANLSNVYISKTLENAEGQFYIGVEWSYFEGLWPLDSIILLSACQAGAQYSRFKMSYSVRI